MQSSTVQRISLGIFLIFSVWLGFYVIQPPEPKPESIRVTEFSADRAFKHVKQIARQPHPLGNAANDSVRRYIVEQLKELGVAPAIQEGIGVAGRFGGGLAGHTENIFAQVEGRNPEKTILLMSHYDSAPNAPGAADDASGIAAILESIRALKSQDDPLKNNIWILITDGEERGLLGAELFVEQFEKLQQIDLVLNFEARGTSGASMMFETNSPNANLIRHFAKGTPYPVANSLMYTVYKLLPNDTDMSVTKRAGLKGLNFAFAQDYLNYHTMQDNPENLSLASLQHHGSNLLGNVRHFGNTNFSLDSNSEYVYFNSATGGLTYYPAGWSLPLAVVAALLFLGYLIYLFRTDRLALGSYLGSLLLFVGISVIGATLTYFGWQGIKLLKPEYQWLYHGEVYAHSWYLWGFSSLMLGLFSGVYSWIQQKWLSVEQLLAGSMTIWMLLSLASAWYLPTASYIFTWPALLALVGWIVLGDQITEVSWQSTGLLAISLFAVLFLIPPYIFLVQIMLTTQMLAVSIFLLLLVLGLTWPMVWRIIHSRNRIWTGGFITSALACFIIASASSGFDAEHKKQNDMSYIQNMDTQQAYWISRDHTTDEWTSQFLSKNPQEGAPPNVQIFQNSNYLYHQAKITDIPHPKFKLTADSSSSSLRFISLDVSTQPKAIAMRMAWDEQSSVREVHLDGKTIWSELDHTQKDQSSNGITFFSDFSGSTNLRFTLSKDGKVPKIYFTFLKMGLPTHLVENYSPRAPYMMPTAHWNSNTTLWQIAVNPDTLSME